MQLEIRFAGMPQDPAVVEYVQRHVGFTLGRFYSRIARLVVRLEDVNGPRGGKDKVCRVEARGEFGQLVSQSSGCSPYAALRAIDVLERSVARALKRNRVQGRQALPHRK